jgi:hypothetical protein
VTPVPRAVEVYLGGVDVLLLIAIAALTPVLTWWADRALRRKLLPKVCHHDLVTHSYNTGVTRCLYCGEVLP